jgi:hypothetical protein
LQIEKVAWSAQRISSVVFPGFETRVATFSSKQLLNCTNKAEWTPFQTHYYSEKLVVLGIKPGTSGSVARNSDHWTTEAVKILFINGDINHYPFLYKSESESESELLYN